LTVMFERTVPIVPVQRRQQNKRSMRAGSWRKAGRWTFPRTTSP
jgi:hypothetical protein